MRGCTTPTSRCYLYSPMGRDAYDALPYRPPRDDDKYMEHQCAENWLPRGWDLCRRWCSSKADYRDWRGKTLVCYEPYTVCHDFCE